MRPIITLTTDFGHGSPYVAQMKGVILSLCREVELIDITHGVRPQNIREGAVVLSDTLPRFPPGTVHVAVVDPGVGTSRKLIYAELGSQRYLAPDNGLLSLLTAEQQSMRLISLENSAFWLPNPSPTFHGRDILAPVAAHLAAGLDPTALGPRLDELATLDWPRPDRSSRGRLTGEVLYVDSFGNLITNLRRNDIESMGAVESLVVDCAGHRMSALVFTYGIASPGARIALFDSQGRLEIAVVGGNAATELGVSAGAKVTISAAD